MVSVCIATFNGEEYIEEQLASILSQLTSEDEVIISDDGSTDQTIQIINSFKDCRIRLIRHSKTKCKFSFDYTTHNFENALQYAQGDYIFLADQDDIWLPGKVKIMCSYLQKNTLVLSDCKMVNSRLETISESYFKCNQSGKGIWKNIIHNSYLGCCMAFQRELLKKAFPFPKSAVAHDIWLGLLAEKFGKVVFLDVPMILYRRHGKNVSCSGERSKNSIGFKIYYRLMVMINILKR